MKGAFHALGVIAFLFLVTGCGDKELEARSREQQVRIAELQAKVDSLNARLGTPVEGNPEEDLKRATQAMEDAGHRVEELRAELADLTQQRADLEKEFEKYRREYPIPE